LGEEDFAAAFEVAVEKESPFRPTTTQREVKNMFSDQRILEVVVINEGGSVIVEKVKNGKGNMGYDALLDIMIPDMLAAGIVDPVKVTRSGVEHATSAAAIFLTTDVAIADLPEKEKPQMPNPGMGMDY
jgi:chaperonin GroEL (HSP60 family)